MRLCCWVGRLECSRGSGISVVTIRRLERHEGVPPSRAQSLTTFSCIRGGGNSVRWLPGGRARRQTLVEEEVSSLARQGSRLIETIVSPKNRAQTSSKTQMNVQPLAISDVKLIAPKRIEDSRGYFAEVFKADWFRSVVADVEFIQQNESLSRRAGTLARPSFAGIALCARQASSLPPGRDVRRGCRPSPRLGDLREMAGHHPLRRKRSSAMDTGRVRTRVSHIVGEHYHSLWSHVALQSGP